MFFLAHGTASGLLLYLTGSYKAERACGILRVGGREEPAEAAEPREGRQVGRGQASTETAKPGQSACQGLTHYRSDEKGISAPTP